MKKKAKVEPKITLRVFGDTQKIFKDDLYHGEVTKIKNSYSWKNSLADQNPSVYTLGVASTEYEAFLMLGFTLKRTPDNE